MIQNIDLIDKKVPIRAVIASANNQITIDSAKQALDKGLIVPMLVGNHDYIKNEADRIGWQIDDELIIDTKNESESAYKSCQLAQNDQVSLIVKGHMHTDVLMGEYIKSKHSLRLKGRRLSHIWFMTFNDSERQPLVITDGALNIKPSLETKKAIIGNVINFIEKIESFDPKIAILSATEEMLDQMESSLDAGKLVEWSKDLSLIHI